MGKCQTGARRLVVIFCFALNLLLGYLAMLVVMTYSFELFSSVIIGLVAGHSFFNWNSAVGESVDPCCSNQGWQILSFYLALLSLLTRP